MPKRGLQREEREKNLAQQWERLVRDREKLPRALQEDFATLFRAMEDASAARQVSVCGAVEVFFQTSGRLPRRQEGDTAGKREEDALAQRWDRLLEQGVEEAVRERFGKLFNAEEAASAAGQLAVCGAVELFFQSSGRLPRRQPGDGSGKAEEDALAKRWDRLLEQGVEESVRERFRQLFSAEEGESTRGERGVGEGGELDVGGVRVCL